MQHLPPRGVRAENQNKELLSQNIYLILSFVPFLQIKQCCTKTERKSKKRTKELKGKEGRKVLKSKVFLAHLEFVPTLVAISDLSYLLQFFDFANLSHPPTRPNEQAYPLPPHRGIRHALTTASTDISAFCFSSSSLCQFPIWALACVTT